MIGPVVLRVARPTNNLEAIARMYVEGLGFNILGAFENHRGFDGVILGHPHTTYHLEFTSRHGHRAGTAPDAEHLLVFYMPDQADWKHACERAAVAGFEQVPSTNPYWDGHGRTFKDIDGYHIVLQHDAWSE
jgi:hypothetical protein